MEDKASSGNTAVAENTASNPTPTKKAAKSKAKVQKSKNHPRTSDMVTAAMKELNDRKGSSLQAIKKYIATAYKVDGEKFAPFIKRYLKTAVTSGAVVQTKGKGASGSFKLASQKSETKAKVKKPVKKPEIKEKKVPEKKVAAKKAAPAPKKAAPTKKPSAVAKKQAAEKKVKTVAAKKAETAAKKAAQPKTVSKAKKATKAPAAKTKTPKPKTAKSAKTTKSQAKK